MSSYKFDTHNKRDGKPKTCKFCKQPVWWHRFESRWYDVGGEKLHVESCALRRKYFKNESLDREEQQRQRR